ncbi:CPBP family intramembrane glutamic endopeptidase [Phaeobacter sp. HF9A]|uniref:CPBP family intramembrane glutamic endopeptidase n=1 Tax=Phaeobacter sp. HF9A TaxID=2721561 RepID=UPI001430F03D|nr:type II CAAX endopeptidase family protein [Phaeobacter sp. HF9A]NIZ12505.1 CPBP family intramembrane metalloprotease [Phaeobacter sp. HF9A]
MPSLLKAYPAVLLTVVAMALGTAPILAVASGARPSGISQLGAFSASLAAFLLVAMENGWAGVRDLMRRALIWRVGWFWWAFALFFPIFPAVASLYLYHALGGPYPDWSHLKPIWQVIPMILILTLLAGFGEEFGWRGFALPRLKRKHTALGASLVIGVCWGMWHIPLFLAPGTVQSQWLQDGGWLTAVGGYTLFCIAWSVQYTWVFNNTRGSVLVAAVMHGAGNAWFGGYIDVYRGHFEGILVFAAVMAAISLLIVVTSGAERLSSHDDTINQGD